MRVSVHSPHLTTPPSGGEAWRSCNASSAPSVAPSCLQYQHFVKQSLGVAEIGCVDGTLRERAVKLAEHSSPLVHTVVTREKEGHTGRRPELPGACGLC